MALFRARTGLATVRGGERVQVYAGQIVESPHWLLDLAPDSFQPLKVDYPAEAAKAKPRSKATDA